ncbi:MAG: MFS transporter [Promethearchaeota archaeon]
MGQAKAMRLGFLLIALTYLPGLWITTLEEAIIFGFIGGAAVGGYWIPLGLVSSDVYDECTVSTGKHQEAMYEGIRTFFYRLSLIFVGIAIPVVHIITGFNPDPKAVQTPLAIWGIRVHRSLIPALLCFLAFIIMTKWYDLYGEKLKVVKKKLIEMGL